MNINLAAVNYIIFGSLGFWFERVPITYESRCGSHLQTMSGRLRFKQGRRFAAYLDLSYYKFSKSSAIISVCMRNFIKEYLIIRSIPMNVGERLIDFCMSLSSIIGLPCMTSSLSCK